MDGGKEGIRVGHKNGHFMEADLRSGHRVVGNTTRDTGAQDVNGGIEREIESQMGSRG